MKCSPVLVSVYSRKDHFKRCIESLKTNKEAQDTVLYVVSDLWGREEDREIVLLVREYIDGISGFKRVIPLYNSENLGAHNSICRAIEKVLSENDRVIFLEDDIVVSSTFLNYMNEGLELYASEKSIFSICGFTYNSLRIPSDYTKETFLWSRNSPWGFGTWNDRWKELDLELHDFPSFMSNRQLVREFKRIAPSSWNVLMNDRKGQIKALDVRLSYNMFMHHQYSVFPIKTLTMNTGFDGSGVNCGTNNALQKKHLSNELYHGVIHHDNRIKPDNRIYRAQRKIRTSLINDYIRPFVSATPFASIWKKIRKMIKL